jgi:RNA polymerase sigma factor (sigma-70 family)
VARCRGVARHEATRNPVQGDFAAWYQHEAPEVARTLGVALGDGALAEEATAEAFAKAFARWEQVRLMTSPVGWVYRVALNEARRGFRRRRLEERFIRRCPPVPEVPAPGEPLDPVRDALRALPTRARTAVALRYFADLPEAEIAALMGVSRGTVAATLHQARRQLAVALAGEYQEVAS